MNLIFNPALLLSIRSVGQSIIRLILVLIYRLLGYANLDLGNASYLLKLEDWLYIVSIFETFLGEEEPFYW